MTSERQIEANRRNGRKSRGPCSVAGKSTASRNALRHGLASVTHSQPVSPEVIEGFAKALCGNDENPALFEQARIIGKNELVLRAIGAQQLAVVERLRDPSATALAKGDSRLKKARARFRKAQVAFDELVALRDRLLEKYKDELPPPIRSEQGYETMPGVSNSIPAHLLEYLLDKEEEDESVAATPVQETTRCQDEVCVPHRDETAAMEEAVKDLVRLDRYERRARSRQKQAIRAFMNIRLTKSYGETSTASD